MTKIKLLFLILSLFSFSNACATPMPEQWREYIDGTVGKPSYYLMDQVKKSFTHHRCYRVLDLGVGAGNEIVPLVAKGWEITGVDLSPRSREVMTERIKGLPGKFHFYEGNFLSVPLTGYYDLVISFFSLPFGNKNELMQLLAYVSQHMSAGAILAANFFGYQHDLVKQGITYGLSKEEVINYLTTNHFNISMFLNRIYDRNESSGNIIHWDVIDVIAVKEAG